MSKELAVLATVAAGGFVAAQPPVNNVLSKKVGTLRRRERELPRRHDARPRRHVRVRGRVHSTEGVESPAWYYWVFGGVAGVAIVLTTLITVRELGAGGVTAAMIAGQLTLSVVLDRLGVLGLEERAITWEKVLGIALLAAGTVLIVRE